MNIEHLRYVLEVERAGSISQAAENLFMGQPNLSKAIKELEQALHITIFKRTSKGAEITPKGREFIHYAQSILRQYEEIEALGQTENGAKQILRVSVPRASYMVEAFTSLLAGLDTSLPIQADFYETNALRAIRRVSDGHSGIGVIRYKTDYQNYFSSMLEDNGLVGQPLLTFSYLILLSQSHPLAQKKAISAQELQPFIEIIHGDTTIPYTPNSMIETECGTAPGNKKVRVYERGSQFDILARVPGSYMRVSPIPKDLLQRNGLVQRHSPQSPRFSDLLIYQKRHRFSLLEKQYMDLLNQSAEEISQASIE